MKLDNPKSWYEKSADLEGNFEIGAGIPPGSSVRSIWGGQLVSPDVKMSLFVHKTRGETAPSKPKTVRIAAKAACLK